VSAASYRVTRDDGTVVRPGDTVRSFRDEPAEFVGVTRGPEPGRSAKVTVRVGGATRERYAGAYDLTVTEEREEVR
jgi:hypothetical protein